MASQSCSQTPEYFTYNPCSFAPHFPQMSLPKRIECTSHTQHHTQMHLCKNMNVDANVGQEVHINLLSKNVTSAIKEESSTNGKGLLLRRLNLLCTFITLATPCIFCNTGCDQTYFLPSPATVAMEDVNNGVHMLSQSFPDEMIVEILSRLPVKSLMRFRSVSKSWLSLISTPAFIKLHLKTAVNNSECSHNRLICTFNHPRIHFREYSLPLILCEPEVNPMILDWAARDSNCTMHIVGSGEGLICVVLGEDNFVLWNPSIRKYKCVPRLHAWDGYGCYLKNGSGYVELTDDYKVVAIFYCIFHHGPYAVHVYSLKTNEWRRIEDFSFGTPLDHSGKYASGKLHWLVDCDGCLDIVSLDLITERYGKMGAPCYGAIRSRTNMNFDEPCVTLGLFSDKLCLLFDDHRTHMDLWVMKEYGMRNSWARALVLSHLGNPGFFPHMLRLWSLNNGKILLLYGSIVVIYNPKDKTWGYPEIDEAASIYQADMYVESLVSPCDG